MLRARVCLTTSMATELRELARNPGGELLTLSVDADSVEKVDVACVERWSHVVAALWENSLFILSTARLEEIMCEIDASFEGQLSGAAASKAARRRWARYEAEKIHAVLSYTARLCRRAASSKSVKVNNLKRLWQAHHNTTDRFEAWPDG